uniref:Uncharacterized protein n=1 Tax=Cannabis sativa TaxID=3483 RepID=A0A803NL94_CANSA
MQSNSIGPRRILVPQRPVFAKSAPSSGNLDESRKSREVVSVSEDHRDSVMQMKRTTAIAKDSQEDELTTPPSNSGTITRAFDDNLNPYEIKSKKDPVFRSKQGHFAGGRSSYGHWIGELTISYEFTCIDRNGMGYRQSKRGISGH